MPASRSPSPAPDPRATAFMGLMPIEDARREVERLRWMGELATRHRAKLVRVARAEGLSPEEALDAVQDGFVTFVERPEWHDLPRETPDAERLLATLVRNQARNQRRRHSRLDASLDDVGEPSLVDHARRVDDLIIAGEEHVRLTGCISALKEVQRSIVTARLLEGASGIEIARELGLTPGNVAVILHRAASNLRSCLDASRERLRAAGRG
ncbi:MAG: sigma-70 family RNA polymerase sigma factor [Myxococcales bacterium]|nr:sigma-70 family RNA polymerase sigma factor [Myxococcales bacterium]